MRIDLTMRDRREGILHVRLPLGLKERAERVARADRRTLTSIVEIALEKELMWREKQLAKEGRDAE